MTTISSNINIRLPSGIMIREYKAEYKHLSKDERVSKLAEILLQALTEGEQAQTNEAAVKIELQHLYTQCEDERTKLRFARILAGAGLGALIGGFGGMGVGVYYGLLQSAEGALAVGAGGSVVGGFAGAGIGSMVDHMDEQKVQSENKKFLNSLTSKKK